MKDTPEAHTPASRGLHGPGRPVEIYSSEQRIELLEQIEATGSISRAAKQIKLSYKAAWDALDTMNNLSEQPLVVCSAGGAEGGGTRLTAFGREMVNAWRSIQLDYRRLTRGMARSSEHFALVDRRIQALSLKTSARNQYRGRITAIEQDLVSGSVTLDIGENIELVASLTRDSIEALQLAVGMPAMALIKASFVLLSPDPQIRISTRNRLHGKLLTLIPGTVNSEVKLRLAAGRTLTALVTNESIEELDLAAGQPCTALIEAAHILIAVD